MMSIMLGGKVKLLTRVTGAQICADSRYYQDPSAILISWAIFLAGRHPNVFLRMKEEVERV